MHAGVSNLTGNGEGGSFSLGWQGKKANKPISLWSLKLQLLYVRILRQRYGVRVHELLISVIGTEVWKSLEELKAKSRPLGISMQHPILTPGFIIATKSRGVHIRLTV